MRKKIKDWLRESLGINEDLKNQILVDEIHNKNHVALKERVAKMESDKEIAKPPKKVTPYRRVG